MTDSFSDGLTETFDTTRAKLTGTQPAPWIDFRCSSNSFRQSLKTNVFRRYHSTHTAQLRCFMTLRICKPIIDIDINI